MNDAERRATATGLVGAVLALIAAAVWVHPAVSSIVAVFVFLLLYAPLSAFYGRKSR